MKTRIWIIVVLVVALGAGFIGYALGRADNKSNCPIIPVTDKP